MDEEMLSKENANKEVARLRQLIKNYCEDTRKDIEKLDEEFEDELLTSLFCFIAGAMVLALIIVVLNI